MQRKTFATTCLTGVMTLVTLTADRAAASPPADPATSTSYPCHYIENWVWN